MPKNSLQRSENGSNAGFPKERKVRNQQTQLHGSTAGTIISFNVKERGFAGLSGCRKP
jgi:hypothetical protein